MTGELIETARDFAALAKMVRELSEDERTAMLGRLCGTVHIVVPPDKAVTPAQLAEIFERISGQMLPN